MKKLFVIMHGVNTAGTLEQDLNDHSEFVYRGCVTNCHSLSDCITAHDSSEGLRPLQQGDLIVEVTEEEAISHYHNPTGWVEVSRTNKDELHEDEVVRGFMGILDDDKD